MAIEVSVILAIFMPFTKRDISIRNVMRAYIRCKSFHYEEKTWTEMTS